MAWPPTPVPATPRASWGYRQVRNPARPRSFDSLLGVELHHEARFFGPGASAPRRIFETQEYHINRKNMSTIFYNYLIDPWTGKLWEGRPPWFLSTSDGDAEWYLTVCVLGHLDQQVPTTAAVHTIEALRRWTTGQQIRGHRERPYATACPGVHGMAIVQDLRKAPTEPPPPSLIGDDMILGFYKYEHSASGAVYAAHTDGTKKWVPTGDALAQAQILAQAQRGPNFDVEVHIVNAATMQALGPVIGPRHYEDDQYGL